MNFTYTLTPDEVRRQAAPRPRAIGFRWAHAAEAVLSGIFLAAVFAQMFPAVAIMGVLVAAPLAAAQFSRRATFRMSSFRISVGRANDPMQVVVTSETISTQRGSEATAQRWAALQRFTVGDDGVVVEFADGTRRWVPERAFASAADRDAFLAFVVQQAPPSVGYPPKADVAEDTRPIVTLASGTWRWSIEHTPASRATLWLEDPADDRVNISAEIDDEWVEWTAERLDAAIGVPSRRDFVDADGVTWRIEFPAKNVAEAHTVDRPEYLPTISGIVWVLAHGASAADTGLPWSGLAHVPGGELREWFARERRDQALTSSSAAL